MSILTHLRLHTSPQAYQRGEAYYQEGAVLSVIQRGDAVEAAVAGSDPDPYVVRFLLAGDELEQVSCTCPYDWGGWCKHIAAAVLAFSDGSAVERRLPLAEALAPLDRDQLARLLLRLAERRPEVMAEVEACLPLLSQPPASGSGSQAESSRPAVLVNPQILRRQIGEALRSEGDTNRWGGYVSVGGVLGRLERVLDQAWNLIRQGDGANALVALDAITDAYLADWETLDDSDGMATEFVSTLGTAWAEAILSTQLGPADRDRWRTRLEEWCNYLSDYGSEAGLEVALGAVEFYWDDAELQRILAGTVVEADAGADDGQEPFYGVALTVARLHVLERQGRSDEYLRLAAYEGLYVYYAQMLVQIGRIDEAVACTMGQLQRSDEVLTVAKALHGAGATARALDVAQWGLRQPGAKLSLSTWTRDLASADGKGVLALEATVVICREHPNLQDYADLQQRAGAAWPKVRAALLDHLRPHDTWAPDGKVDIFLKEGLIDDAIAVVTKGFASYETLAKVAEAATMSRPDWTIATSRRQAEEIMDAGRSQYYAAAAAWLERARAAYLAAGREAEWRIYQTELLAKHARKYRLVPLIRELR